MRVYFIFILAALSASCASISTKDTTSPYQQYVNYSKSLSSGSYDKALVMLSSYNQNRFKDRDTNESFEDYFPFFSSVDSVVINEVRHFQKFTDSKACLTISGFNKEGEPTSLNFELVSEDEVWKFQYVHMIYHGNEKEFPAIATCPTIP